MKSLNVAIDISPLFSPKTGIGQHTSNLIEHIEKNENNCKFHYFNGIGWHKKDGIRADSISRRHISVRIFSRTLGYLGKPGILLKNHFNKIYQDIYSFRSFIKGAKKNSIDIYHGTNYELYKTDIPSVLTVYDISCFRHPETHPKWRVEWQNKRLPQSIDMASHIITISEYSKKEIIDYFKIPDSKITVTYCGVNNDFTPKDVTICRRILAKYSLLYKEYMLSVGTIEPRKNLITLIHAHTSLPDSLQRKYPLVLVGMSGWKESKIYKFAKKFIDRGTIKTLGYVHQDDLPYIYSGAKLFGYPSIYEGFGIPPLESMASGVPVIVSNKTSLPEVTGEAAIMLDPYDIDKWTETINNLFEDEKHYTSLIEKGLNRAKNFTWDNTAAETIAVYNRLIN